MSSVRARAACPHRQPVGAAREAALRRCAVRLRAHASHCGPQPAPALHPGAARRPGYMVCRAADGQESPAAPDPPNPAGPPRDEGSEDGPTFMEGVNFYCYVVLGLLFVTDLTPVGQLVRLSGLAGSGTGAAVGLSLFQWVFFVVPTISWISDRKWSFRKTLRLEPASPAWCLGAAGAGALLWAVIASALAAKSGVSLFEPQSAAAQSVLGGLVQKPSSAGEWGQLVLAAAVSPAVAEELLFRGVLLSALLKRLGRVDAVLLCGALFAASHLDLDNFFSLAVLGMATGGAAVASGSLLPAVALHLGYNSAALVVGGLS